FPYPTLFRSDSSLSEQVFREPIARQQLGARVTAAHHRRLSRHFPWSQPCTRDRVGVNLRHTASNHPVSRDIEGLGLSEEPLLVRTTRTLKEHMDDVVVDFHGLFDSGQNLIEFVGAQRAGEDTLLNAISPTGQHCGHLCPVAI